MANEMSVLQALLLGYEGLSQVIEVAGNSVIAGLAGGAQILLGEVIDAVEDAMAADDAAEEVN